MANKSSLGSLRIIAGKWRGRKLDVLDIDGLRPTPNRVRETVFNWLQPFLAEAHCLDLFAGSGALGFEAISRGAAGVTMIELNTTAAGQLQSNCQILSADNCLVENKTAQAFIGSNTQQFDIVFIDPPYQAELWTEIANQLVATNCLANKARIYVECPSNIELPALPEQWQLIKDKKAGDVRYCLFLNDLGDVR